MKHLSSWFLGGMLLASLGWNLAPRRVAPAPATDSCSLDAPGLDLAPDQRERLDAACASACARADDYERRAEAVRAELRLALAADEVDVAAARALVARAAELHRLSLESCLDGVLALRDVLTPAQRAELLGACDGCDTGAGSCR